MSDKTLAHATTLALDVAAVVKELLGGEASVLRSRFETVLGRSLLVRDIDAMCAIAAIASGMLRVHGAFDRVPHWPRVEWIKQTLTVTSSSDPRFARIRGLLAGLPWETTKDPRPELGFSALNQGDGMAPKEVMTPLPEVWSQEALDLAEKLILTVLDALPAASKADRFVITSSVDGRDVYYPLENMFNGLVTWTVDIVRAFFASGASSSGERSLAQSRVIAADTLRRIGIDSSAARAALPAAMSPRMIDGYDRHRPLQNKMLEGLGVRNIGHERLYLIEAGTGEGKTALPLCLFYEHLFRAGLVDGLDYSLPTKTSARYMQPRLFDSFGRVFGTAAPPVTLGIYGEFLLDSSPAPLTSSGADWGDTGDRRYRGWATERPERQFAGGGAAIATVDQMVKAIAVHPFANYRFVTICRNLVVIDEALGGGFANRPYVERLVRDLLSVGAYVVLIGVVLPAGFKAKILEREGFGAEPLFDAAVNVPYPTITHASGEEGAPATPVPVRSSRAAMRDFDVELLYIPDVVRGVAPANEAQEAPAAEPSATAEPPKATGKVVREHDFKRVVEYALDEAAKGRNVCILRNTWLDTRDTDKALEMVAKARGQTNLLTWMKDGRICPPFHSYYSLRDRRMYEDVLRETFGPEAYKDPSKPRGKVVVMVLSFAESIDVSFDTIVTDLTPMDRFLNRAGRIARFDDMVRGKMVVLILAVTLAAWQAESISPEQPWLRHDGRPVNPGRLRHGIGSNLAPDLLSVHATWDELASLANGVMHVPDDNRRYVERCLNRNALKERADRLGGAWALHWAFINRKLDEIARGAKSKIAGIGASRGGKGSASVRGDSDGVLYKPKGGPNGSFTTDAGNIFDRMMLPSYMVMRDGPVPEFPIEFEPQQGSSPDGPCTVFRVESKFRMRDIAYDRRGAFDFSGSGGPGPDDEDVE